MDEDFEMIPMASEDRSMITLVLRSVKNRPITDEEFIEVLRSYTDFMAQSEGDSTSLN